MENSEVEEHDYLEVPSCIESLVSSAEQMQQLADRLVYHYQKLILCYGYALETRLTSEDEEEGVGSFSKNDLRSSSNLDDQAVMSFSTLSSSRNSPSNRAANQDDLFKKLDLTKVANDNTLLQALNSVLKVLPLLNEICLLVERCFATIESTFKRVAYHLTSSLALQSDQKESKFTGEEPFRLTNETKIDAIFVALMDLIYALACLEQALRDHTNIASDLTSLVSTCQLIVDFRRTTDKLKQDEDNDGRGKQTELQFEQLPTEKLRELIDFVSNIKLTLALDQNFGIYKCLLDHFQHLDIILNKDKTRPGFNELFRLLGDFIAFHCGQLLEAPHHNRRLDQKFLKSPAQSRILVDLYVIPKLFINSTAKRLLGLSSLYGLFSVIFKRMSDKRKYCKILNQTLRKHAPGNNVVVLDGSNCFITLGQFLRHHLIAFESLQLDVKFFDQLDNRLANQIDYLANNFDRLTMQTNCWLIKLRQEALKFDCSTTCLATMNPTEFILLHEQGLLLANDIQSTIRNCLAIHQHLSEPISKNNLILIFRLVIVLKSIERNVLSENFCTNFTATNLMKIQLLARLGWRKLFASFRKQQFQVKYSERRLNLATLLSLTSVGLKPELLVSSQGKILLSIYLSMLTSVLVTQKELLELNLLIHMTASESLVERFQQSTDCSFLYWNLSTFGIFYNYAFEEFPGAFNELHYFHMAIGDLPKLLAPTDSQLLAPQSSCLIEAREHLLERLGSELMAQFRSDYLDRVCQELEMELRLQTHCDLCADEHKNPFKRHLYNFKQMFAPNNTNGAYFRIINQTINLNQYLEHHLNKICYNLTAIAPHDWFTYDSMMNLARQKYSLKFANSQLPAQTIDCGLDLLDIARNLPLFAARYSYDLTNQLFIEKCLLSGSGRATAAGSIVSSQAAGSMVSGFAPSSSGQWLNVLQIEHVSKSLHTHGFGVLDSAVNCTYQALKKLVNLFARQLRDDQLRAALQKELIDLNCGSCSVGSKKSRLSYEKANRLAKRFKLKASTLSHDTLDKQRAHSGVDLDSIRQTVTQLGNLLAFIRLLKSGALNCASKSVDYVPELAELAHLRLAGCVPSEFGDYEPRLVARLHEASKNFDQCLQDLEANFEPWTNYLSIIVKLFSELLSANKKSTTALNNTSSSSSSSSNLSDQQQQQQPVAEPDVTKTTANLANREHLESFFLLVPALIIEYIDYLINCKERLTSRSSAARFGSLISDDGFAMGIAFLLTTLSQTRSFLSLQWLESTCSRLEEEIQEVEKRLNNVKLEESLRQTSSITVRRLKRLHDEYRALNHTLNCALLLFRSCNLENGGVQ